MVRTKEELKSFLQTGDKPSESQWGDLVDTLFHAIELADEAGGGGGEPSLVYEHHQATPQIVWTVIHNRGVIPSIEILDDNLRAVEAEYYHLDSNTTIISNNFSCTGFVRCYPK